MPIYEYNCQGCGNVVDVLQKLNDPAPEECASCGAKGTLSRMVSRTSFVLKGGGWYSDLYGSSKKEGKSGAAASSSPSASSPKTETSSAPSTPSTPSTGTSGSGGSGTGGSTPSKT